MFWQLKLLCCNIQLHFLTKSLRIIRYSIHANLVKNKVGKLFLCHKKSTKKYIKKMRRLKIEMLKWIYKRALIINTEDFLSNIVIYMIIVLFLNYLTLNFELYYFKFRRLEFSVNLPKMWIYGGTGFGKTEFRLVNLNIMNQIVFMFYHMFSAMYIYLHLNYKFQDKKKTKKFQLDILWFYLIYKLYFSSIFADFCLFVYFCLVYFMAYQPLLVI